MTDLETERARIADGRAHIAAMDQYEFHYAEGMIWMRANLRPLLDGYEAALDFMARWPCPASVPTLFEHGAGIIVLPEVVSVCRHGLDRISADCEVVLRNGTVLPVKAEDVDALMHAVKAYHAASGGAVLSEIKESP